jgi:hypothetical protein
MSVLVAASLRGSSARSSTGWGVQVAHATVPGVPYVSKSLQPKIHSMNNSNSHHSPTHKRHDQHHTPRRDGRDAPNEVGDRHQQAQLRQFAIKRMKVAIWVVAVPNILLLLSRHPVLTSDLLFGLGFGGRRDSLRIRISTGAGAGSRSISHNTLVAADHALHSTGWSSQLT